MGIPVRLHYSLVILPLLLLSGSTLTATADSTRYHLPVGVALLLSVGIPFSILLHELGHCVVARHFGSGTRDILLTPIGGIAFIRNMLFAPRAECLMALAGPAVSLILGLVFAIGAVLLWGLGMAFGLSGSIYTTLLILFQSLSAINIMLVLFNIIPAFPMDGGRVLRALLASRVGLEKSTLIASRLGKLLSIVFIVMGLILPGMPGLIIIGPLIYIAADREYRMVRMIFLRQRLFQSMPDGTDGHPEIY